MVSGTPGDTPVSNRTNGLRSPLASRPTATNATASKTTWRQIKQPRTMRQREAWAIDAIDSRPPLQLPYGVAGRACDLSPGRGRQLARPDDFPPLGCQIH